MKDFVNLKLHQVFHFCYWHFTLFASFYHVHCSLFLVTVVLLWWGMFGRFYFVSVGSCTALLMTAAIICHTLLFIPLIVQWLKLVTLCVTVYLYAI